MIDYYAILEVDCKASQEEIKKAYLLLIKKFHPDVTQFDKKYSEEKTRILNEAYSVLSDVEKRKEYDKKYFANNQDNSIDDDLNVDDENSEEFNTIVRVIKLCKEYIDLIENHIVRKAGYENQNSRFCNEYYSKFSNLISKDFQYLVAHNLLHDEISDCISLTYISFASFFTWSNEFIKAEKVLNIVSSFIEKFSKVYPNFIKIKNSVSKNADYERDYERKIQQKAFNKMLRGEHNNYNEESGILLKIWNSFGPRAKGQLIILAIIGLFYGYGWICDLTKNSSHYSNNSSTSPSVSSQYLKKSTLSSGNDNNTNVSKSINQVKPVDVKPLKKIEEPKPLTPVRNVKTGYVKGSPMLNNGGLCELTIDNMRNQEAVYVRLWTVYPNKPVRAFNIAGGDSFTVRNLSPDIYEIRYKYLYEEKDAKVGSKSDSFNLTQIDTGYGIQYSTSTITLYKVVNGNFHTNTIDVDDV